MVKLKDNVTYQKLNAIGFRLDNFNECYIFEYGEDVTICIYKNNRILWTYIEDGYEYRELAYDGCTTIEELKEYCPKLAGLVEKVDDKQ